MEHLTAVWLSWSLLILLVSGCHAVYRGKKVGSLSTLAHAVSGEVYAMNNNTLQLVNFNYDGGAPAGRFYIGLTSDSPDGTGRAIADEKGMNNKLGQYIGKTIILTLPSDVSVSRVRWFSVWCTEFNMDFGNVIVPSGFVGPVGQSVGQFSRLAHKLSTGDVFVKDTKTVTINNIIYDGRGPDAFFILGTGAVASPGYQKIPDEKNSTSKVDEYKGQTIHLTLPKGTSILGFSYLALYCIAAVQNFGNVNLPANLQVPFHPETIAEMDQDGTSDLDNCEQLAPDYNVAWSVNSSHITLEFVSVLGSGRYMAFGLSGSNSASVMRGADVIVARYSDGSPPSPMAVDYYLEDYAQCSVGKGACPDENSGGNQDLRVIGGSKVNGVVRVKVVRSLDTMDPVADKVYTPGQAQYVVWARGGLNKETYVTKHDLAQRLSGSKTIDFGRTPDVTGCGTITPPTTPSGGDVWKEQKLYGRDTQVFNVKLGPTGGDKGYKAITGQQPWGIAYYINGLLIPHIELRRGGNYTFVVEGGHNMTHTAKYHPFYVTTDPRGGYTTQTAAQRDEYKVYVGIDTATHTPTPHGVGRYCEYISSGGIMAAQESATFSAFRATLSVQCDPGPPAGHLYFSPDANTPEWLYYQCYTHFRLGWKIHIVDEYTSGSTRSSPLSTTFTTLLLLLLLLLLSISVTYSNTL